MTKAIIGYTGFVGGNLSSQCTFDLSFNSSNIKEILKKEIDLLVIAAPSAAKWKANQDPQNDWSIISALLDIIKKVHAQKVVYISTVDVYRLPFNVDEDTKIIPEDTQPYGKHRFYIEEFVRAHFPQHLIVRLPGLFGKGLKKNFIFDMLHNNCLHLTHKESVFQFYCLDNLWKDIQIALRHNLNLINFATEPTSASEIAHLCFQKNFTNTTESPPVFYDMQSKYALLYNGTNKYLYNKSQVIAQLKDFIKNYAP